MFEILFLAFAITTLLRWPKTCAACANVSALPSGPEYQISGDAADRAPHRRKTAGEAELTEIGSLSKWPSLRHANDNKRRL